MSLKKLFCLFCLIFFVTWNVSAFDSENPREFMSTNSISIILLKDYSKFTVKEMSLTGNNCGYLSVNIYKERHPFYGRIVSSSGKVLGYFPNWEMTALKCSDYFDSKTKQMSGGCEEMNQAEIHLRIPFFSDGKSLEIFNLKGEKILTIDISSVAMKWKELSR